EVDPARHPAADTEDERVVLALAAAQRGAIARRVRTQAARDEHRQATGCRSRYSLMQTRTVIQVSAERIHEVPAQRGAWRQFVRPSSIRLQLLGLLQAWIHPLPLQGDGARYHLVLAGEIAERLAGLVERTVGISQTGSVACVERIAEPVTARVHRGKHDIRI